ncbi:MAG: peptidylprolyl isomerase [Peptococcaceae bacterium]|nr:peptidylprolyl isomerase [Peptococcaceae bacterium]
MSNPQVEIKMKSGNSMTVELYPDVAPNTVNNFLFLANNGFYNNLIFHRVIKGFMIQGGDPQGTGTGGPGYTIKGEFRQNGFTNDLKHDRGVISMARAMHPDSAGSQFFIMHAKAPHLDGAYAAFGKLIDGFDELDRIAGVKTNFSDKPLEDEVIEKMTVQLNGYELQPPQVIR